MVAEVVPGCEVDVRGRARQPTLRNYRVDFTKVETKLPGYKPTWTLRKGIEELYQAYTKNKMSKPEWDGPRYYRLKTIKRLQENGEVDADLRRLSG